MAREGDGSASSVVTADVVTLAAPIEGYLQYGKLAPGDLLDTIIPSPRFTIRWWTDSRLPKRERACRRSTASCTRCSN